MGLRLWSDGGPFPVYVAKGARVYVSGLLSLMLPAYLTVLGYSPFFVGAALAAILAGSASSNVVLTYLGRAFGRRRILLGFSVAMAASGLLLATSASGALILVACVLGNISTTGTEAGPFQSVEAGVLPELVGGKSLVRAFGVYNLVGYAASALGAFTLYVPGSAGDSVAVFRALFLLFALVGVLLFVIYSRLRGIDPPAAAGGSEGSLSPGANKEVRKLSALFAVDAFGGSFVSQYLLSYWFTVTFGIPDTELAGIFLAANVISAASTYGAALIAQRMGNLRTMVWTHALSSAFLLGVAVSGTLYVAVGFLLFRQAFSQMDVPTRQAMMTEMFARDDRVPAYALTNTVRSGATFAGGPVSAVILASGAASGLLFLGGFSKLAYDAMVFAAYRKRFR